MPSPLSDAVLMQFKRARGDDALLRSRHSLAADLAASEKAIRADLAALARQVEALKPPVPEASPLAAAAPAVRAQFEHPRPPLPEDAVTFLADRLTSGTTVLEWGGGPATPYLCDRVGVLHTVETDSARALVLLDYMRSRTELLDRWRFHYVGARGTTTPTVADRVDAIVVDGGTHPRALTQVGTYLKRDRPGLLVINATDTDPVAAAVAKLDLAGYDCHPFSGTVRAAGGASRPRSAQVWVRRHADGASAEAVHEEITTVWESHDDEQYRQDQSHWRGVGRWDEETWAELGRVVVQRMTDLHRAAGRDWSTARPPVLLEWGPGGGANLHALADRVGTMYGVDISAKNLQESARVLAEHPGCDFRPVLLEGEPESVAGVIDRPVDLFCSTAVFQHFPSPDYGAQVLRTVRRVMAPGGLGYVQIRFDDGTERYRPKSLAEYRERHITATSYSLSAFWDLLQDAGFVPLQIAHVSTAVNYAGFFFTAP